MNNKTEPAANGERPTQVTRAVQLLTISLVIGEIMALLDLAYRTSGSALILAGLIVVVFFLVGFILVWRISARSNWARILLLVLVLINLPFAVLANVAQLKESVRSGVVSIFIEVILWIGTYLLFTKNSNAWFGRHK
jgi:hypothetical protein